MVKLCEYRRALRSILPETVDVFYVLVYFFKLFCRFRGLEKPNEVSELRATVQRPPALKASVDY